ncbi:hypothetical protein Q9Q94_00795 [Uliginosibacterium sp. 31-16]|uniref:hypothetical protein n=1 Tax=Uliginosibacterium sp. 31-16 TaxID=3068315 RepID=UPI00273FE396|nr:hypothetical protein [Uliginosibacterium sp. 31-16]MDP5238045.1 hypothetical protein [Uliginosibacterium sp. 31-16]
MWKLKCLCAIGSSASATRTWLSWPLMIGTLIFLWLILHPGLLNDGDTYWNIATGRWILDHGAVPATDPFSHTVRGQPWVVHTWLAAVLYALVFDAGGWTGVVALTAACYAAALAILTRYLLRHLLPIRALLCVAMALCLVAPHMLARPHALTIPLLVIWTIALVQAVELQRAPPLWLVAVMVLWANLHGGFPVPLGLTAAFALEALLNAEASARRAVVSRWAVFLLLVSLATLLTPHGLDAWRFVYDQHQMSFSLNTITEWKAPAFRGLEPLEIWLLAAAALTLANGLRLPPIRIVLLLGLLHLALWHVRHGELLGLLAPIIVAQPLAAQWGLASAAAQMPASVLDRQFATLAQPARKLTQALTLLMLAVLSLSIGRTQLLQPAAAMSPARAVAVGLAAKPPGPVLNAYEFGGYLIFVGIAPSVDSRAVYGDAFQKRHYIATVTRSPERLAEMLKESGIGWTLFIPAMPAVAAMDQMPGWRRLYADPVAVVHVRFSPGASQPASNGPY